MPSLSIIDDFCHLNALHTTGQNMYSEYVLSSCLNLFIKQQFRKWIIQLRRKCYHYTVCWGKLCRAMCFMRIGGVGEVEKYMTC